jgi:hypothetical protein
MSVPSFNVAIQGQGTASADELNTFSQVGQTSAQLRTFSGLYGMAVLLQGVNTVNDGLGGYFYWNPAGTEQDDNFNFIQPPGSTGQWWRLSLVPPGQGGTYPYDIGFFVTGSFISGEVLAAFVMDREVSFVANYSPSQCIALTAATAASVITIKQNGTSIGTITFGIGGTVGAFAGTAATFQIGDVLEFVGPVTADATLGNLCITFSGTR